MNEMHIVYVAYVTSAAHCAAAKGHLDCIKALHDDDAADLWIASNKGDCPVHEAAMAKHKGTRTINCYRPVQFHANLLCFFAAAYASVRCTAYNIFIFVYYNKCEKLTSLKLIVRTMR